MKALLRRAKAYIGRAEYAPARADLDRLREMEPWNMDVVDTEQRLVRTRVRGTIDLEAMELYLKFR